MPCCLTQQSPEAPPHRSQQGSTPQLGALIYKQQRQWDHLLMYDMVYIDEKWFELTNKVNNYPKKHLHTILSPMQAGSPSWCSWLRLSIQGSTSPKDGCSMAKLGVGLSWCTRLPSATRSTIQKGRFVPSPFLSQGACLVPFLWKRSSQKSRRSGHIRFLQSHGPQVSHLYPTG